MFTFYDAIARGQKYFGKSIRLFECFEFILFIK